MSKFKVEDRVIVETCVGDLNKFNQIGTVRALNDFEILIEFDNYIKGHTGNNVSGYINMRKAGHCWWVCIEEVKLLKSAKKLIKQYGIVKWMKKYEQI